MLGTEEAKLKRLEKAVKKLKKLNKKRRCKKKNEPLLIRCLKESYKAQFENLLVKSNPNDRYT